MNRAAAVAGAVLVGLTLAACSGGGSSSGSSGGETPAQLASRLGCTGLTEGNTEELFVQRLDVCQVDGQDVNIYSFASKGDADSYVKAASAYGPVERAGDTLVVLTESTQARSVITAKLG